MKEQWGLFTFFGNAIKIIPVIIQRLYAKVRTFFLPSLSANLPISTDNCKINFFFYTCLKIYCLKNYHSHHCIYF